MRSYKYKSLSLNVNIRNNLIVCIYEFQNLSHIVKEIKFVPYAFAMDIKVWHQMIINAEEIRESRIKFSKWEKKQ